MQHRIAYIVSRAKYAAIGAAIGAGIGGLISRNAASTGGAIGGLIGATVGEKRVAVTTFVDRVKTRGEHASMSD